MYLPFQGLVGFEVESVLQKIVAIKNTGIFRNLRSVGNVVFDRATLIYAPNGRGKTTFCDICRSLEVGEAGLLEGRSTLGEAEPPLVEIQSARGMLRFEDGAWSERWPDFEIYDTRFIHENVYGGECVEHAHKRSLYNVIVGAQGVALRRKVDELDDAYRRAGRVLNDKKNAVLGLIPGPVPFESFLALEADPEIEGKIGAASRKIAALEQASGLMAKPLLSHINIPVFPDGLPTLLGKTIGDLAGDAEAAVREHMSRNMQQGDEPWLVRGLELKKDDHCPFCAKSLAGSELLAAFETRFSDAYQELRTEIEQWSTSIKSFADHETALALQQAADGNARLFNDWKAYVPVPDEPAIDVEKVYSALNTLREEGITALERKTRSPLETVEVGEAFLEASRSVAEMEKRLDGYNRSVERVNDVICRKREEAERGDLEEAGNELAWLQAARIRHEPDAKRMCAEYLNVLKERTDLKNQKQAARIDLDDHAREVFLKYQNSINRVLERFGTAYRVQNVKEQYRGGKPSSTYCLVIEGKKVELGDGKTSRSSPSFKNTLSAGDRSALALAFFLAKLDQDPGLAQKTVVLDDPFTGQDASRQTCTIQEIRRLSGQAAQVVVLSHDRRFLRNLWDRLGDVTARSLQFAWLGDTTITAWNIEQGEDEFITTYKNLWRFCHAGEGDPEAIGRSIRPLLEEYLRMKLPGEFDEDPGLAACIARIRDATGESPAGQAKGMLNELEEIERQAKEQHFPEEMEGSVWPLDPEAVLALGKRTLALVQSF
jgi:wobble nucleotide-excising tRNase